MNISKILIILAVITTSVIGHQSIAKAEWNDNNQREYDEHSERNHHHSERFNYRQNRNSLENQIRRDLYNQTRRELNSRPPVLGYICGYYGCEQVYFQNHERPWQQGFNLEYRDGLYVWVKRPIRDNHY